MSNAIFWRLRCGRLQKGEIQLVLVREVAEMSLQRQPIFPNVLIAIKSFPQRVTFLNVNAGL